MIYSGPAALVLVFLDFVWDIMDRVATEKGFNSYGAQTASEITKARNTPPDQALDVSIINGYTQFGELGALNGFFSFFWTPWTLIIGFGLIWGYKRWKKQKVNSTTSTS